MFAGGGGPSSWKPLVQQFEVGDFIRLHQDPVRQRATTGAANLVRQQLDRAVEDSVIVWLQNAKSAVIEQPNHAPVFDCPPEQRIRLQQHLQPFWRGLRLPGDFRKCGPWKGHARIRRTEVVPMAWSDPAPGGAKRSPLRDVPVPEALPEGPSPTGPNGPVATPVRRRFRGGEPPLATSPAVAVRMPRYRPPAFARRTSNPAARRIRAGRGSATEWSVDRRWKRGHRAQRGTFSPVSVQGQKPWVILSSQMPVWRAFRCVSPAWPKSIVSGHAGDHSITLRPGISSVPESHHSSTASSLLARVSLPPSASAVRSGSGTSSLHSVRKYGSGS